MLVIAIPFARVRNLNKNPLMHLARMHFINPEQPTRKNSASTDGVRNIVSWEEY